MRGAIPNSPMPMPQIDVAPEASRAWTPSTPAPLKTPRLLSLDVFRGVVIFAMLVVNNLGDGDTTGYFWKHADWPAMNQRLAWIAWWGYASGSQHWQDRATALPTEHDRIDAQLATKREELRLAKSNKADADDVQKLAYESDQLSVQLRAIDEESAIAKSPWTRIPIFTYCTLADYVMPMFMLIIGVAIPFSVASSRARGVGPFVSWLRTIKRVVLLIVLGWILVYFRDQYIASVYGEQPWRFNLGMDVLQLLGVGYLVARMFFILPTALRAILAAALLGWHYYLLRFGYQGIVPAGTFTEHFEAVRYAYANWPIWERITWHYKDIVTIGWVGLLSVPPAAGTMLIGTLIGDWLQRTGVDAPQKVARLAMWGLLLASLGFLLSLDLPFNKPRWSPSYLIYVSGIGAILIAILYAIVDINMLRGWTYPMIVFGTNAITVYWLSIMVKILALNATHLRENRFHAYLYVKYGTLAFVTLTLGIILIKFTKWAAFEIGSAAYALLLIALVPVGVMWLRFYLVPLEPSDSTDVHSVVSIVLSMLKGHLGPWVGGWLFTISFVGFWWLVLEWMFRKRIFWKL